MSCFLIGENTHAHEFGEMLQVNMNHDQACIKESFKPRMKHSN